MAELARGSVFDRPWGRTLGALGLRGLSGQLTLTGADGKTYVIAFANGAIAGAASPIASDAAVRIALTGGLVSTTQVAEIARKQAASPGRDEVELIAEHLRIGADQAMRLRRRTIAQRAARTFSVDKGEFVVDDRITLPIVAGSELDVRTVIYLGARQNLSEVRLAAELGLFGSWFRLKPEAFDDLPQFGFGEAERPILDHLMNGASLGDLEAIEGIDGRVVRATVYALCAANACNVEQARGQGATKPPPMTKGSDPGVRRTPVSKPPATQSPPPQQPAPRTKAPSQQPIVAYRPGVRRPGSQPPPMLTGMPRTAATLAPAHVTPRVSSPSAPPASAPQPPSVSRTITPRATANLARTSTGSNPGVSRTSTGSNPGLRGANRSYTSLPPMNRKLPGADEVKQLIEARAAQLATGADHYALLGVAHGASSDEIRKSYFNLARQLHPDRLSALGIPDDNHVAHKVFAQLNTAFSVLSDAKRRAEYDQLVGRGGESAIREEQAQAEEMAARIVQAEDAYKRGDLALKRDDVTTAVIELARAVDLNPEEADYIALHAWAVFCAAGDKQAVARQTRAAFERAIQKSPRAVSPRFYLGRVERMLGRDKEALDLFKDVLVDKPHHFEAQSEVRAIEARLAGPPPPRGGGLFGRKR